MVLGIPVAIFGTVTPASFKVLDLVMLVGSAALLYVFCKTRHKISRAEGWIMLLAFVAYYVTIFFV